MTFNLVAQKKIGTAVSFGMALKQNSFDIKNYQYTQVTSSCSFCFLYMYLRYAITAQLIVAHLIRYTIVTDGIISSRIVATAFHIVGYTTCTE